MNIKQKTTWKCPTCHSQLPKGDNTNTPVRTARLASPASERSIGSSSPSPSTTNVTLRRPPSKHDDDSVTLGQKSISRNVPAENLAYNPNFEDKLRSIIKQELNNVLENKIKILVTAQLKHMSEQICEFKSSMDFYNAQFESLKTALEEKDLIIKKLQAENEHLLAASRDHGTRLSLMEQSLRMSNVEINGIPEHKAENVVTTVLHLARTVGEQLEDSDIIHATRVAKMRPESNRPRPMIIKLRTPRLRDNLLAAVVSFNKKNSQDKLSSRHLGMAGESIPVYVSEHLCPSNKQLHAATKKLAKELGYKFVWVRNGRVFVRKDVPHAAILIKNLESLSLLKNKE